MKGMTGAQKKASRTQAGPQSLPLQPTMPYNQQMGSPRYVSDQEATPPDPRVPHPPTRDDSFHEPALTDHSHRLSSGLCFCCLHGQVGLHVL